MQREYFTRAFVDALDPAWPQGLLYVHQVLELVEKVPLALPDIEAWSDESGPAWAWGVLPEHPRVGQAWMVVDRRVAQHPFAFVRHARWFINQVMGPGRYKRLGATFAAGAPTKHLAELLGFEFEGTLRQYGPGGEGDFHMYSRIR